MPIESRNYYSYLIQKNEAQRLRKGKLKLLLTPPCSRYPNHSNLQERSCSTQGLSSYHLCPACSPVSLQCCLLLLQVSPQIVATLTISQVAYTNYSILISFTEHKIICTYPLVLKDRNTLIYLTA